MKEQMVFIAVDADDVGEKIGNAVLENDVESLSSMSNSINSGTQVFSQWAEHEGGRVVSSGSDEAIMEIPLSSLEGLEKVKEAYSQQTGFTICIGTGASVSEAAKALIYAKMNGKNQIVDYSPQIEEVMKQSISGDLTEEVGEEVPGHEEHLSPEEKEVHDSTEVMSDEEEIEQEELAAQAEEEGQLPPEAGAEAPEGEMEEPAMEEEIGEEAAMEEMVDSDNPSDEDIDLDGIPDQQEEHGEIDPEIDDLDGDGDVEHEEAMVSEEDAAEYSDEGDYEDEIGEDDEELAGAIEAEMTDDIPMEDTEMTEEIPEEEVEMTDDIPMEEEMPMEEAPEEMVEEDVEPEMEGDATDALKDVIYDSLQSFRQHREHLARISEENPELYKALIYTLQAMIEMAKELGYGDAAEDIMEGEAIDSEDFSEDTAPEEVTEEPAMEEGEAPAEEEESEGEDEGDEEETPEESEDEEEFIKNENLISLIQTMAKTVDKLRLLKSDEDKMQEVKEKIKKKVEAKKSSGKKRKPRKPSVKKPSVPGKKDKKKAKESNDGSFCAKSHKKMRAAGKDCRSNEDKTSPLCSARKKFNCRGKNEEKGAIAKSDKLSGFLKKKELKKTSGGLPTEKVGQYKGPEHVSKPTHKIGTVKNKKIKVEDENGEEKWVNASAGFDGKGPDGQPLPAETQSTVSSKKPKPTKAQKVGQA